MRNFRLPATVASSRESQGFEHRERGTWKERESREERRDQKRETERETVHSKRHRVHEHPNRLPSKLPCQMKTRAFRLHTRECFGKCTRARFEFAQRCLSTETMKRNSTYKHISTTRPAQNSTTCATTKHAQPNDAHHGVPFQTRRESGEKRDRRRERDERAKAREVRESCEEKERAKAREVRESCEEKERRSRRKEKKRKIKR